ncbi:MAG: hypothetical protein N2593_03920 [Patescibacteria group bacterium]|nr:hypothetical protein [Patescibacteria group bacterium]
MRFKKIIFIFVFILLFFLFINQFFSSVFLKNKERINIIFYDKRVQYFSLSSSGINYLINIPINTKVLVPGGYGFYRVGAVGKLAYLEKNPEIIKKTFSGTTSSFVDLYFYDNKDKIYYYENDKNSIIPRINFLFFSSSNANFFDRIILFFKLFNKRKSDYKIIDIKEFDILNQDDFNKLYQGIFYKKKYREIMSTVQIIYKKDYLTAYFLSQIINGEGIRVVDLDTDKNKRNNKIKNCEIITKEINEISKNLAHYFGCNIKKEKNELLISDIIFKIENLENYWSVK